MATPASSLDVLKGLSGIPPAGPPSAATVAATQPHTPQPGQGSLGVLQDLAANPQQEETQPEQEQPSFFERAYQTSPIKGLVDTAKATWDQARAKEEQNQAVAEQAIKFLKSKDYGRAAEVILAHLGSGGLEAIQHLDPGDQVAKDVISSTTQHGSEAYKQFSKGNVGEGIVQSAEAVPVVGPIAGQIGEPLGEDLRNQNWSGAAGDVVGGAASILPLKGGTKAATSEEPGLIRPGTAKIAGEEIPIRASMQPGTKGKLAGTAEYAADSGKLQEFDATKTQPAARKAASNVAAEAADTSKPMTTPPKKDAFGFGRASDELQARSKEVFQKLDELSDRAFSEAQKDAEDYRRDYTYAGRAGYRAALDEQDAIFNKYADQFDSGTLAKARADWAKSQGLLDLKARFDTAVHPTPVELTTAGQPDLGYINGKTLREAITDAMQKDKYGKNEFERAGLGAKHVQDLEDLGRLLEKGNNLHRLNPIMKLVAHGGMGVFGLLGHPMEATGLLSGEYAIGQVMGRLMTNPKATATLVKGLKSSATAAAIANGIRPNMAEEKESKNERPGQD